MRRTRLVLPGLSRYRGRKLESLRRGLLGYWPLQEASGTRYDLSGRGNHLTDNNTVAQGDGPPRVAWASSHAKAAQEYFSIASNPDVQSDGEFTHTAWANMATKTVEMGVVTKYASGGQEQTILSYDQPIDRWRWHLVNTGGGSIVLGANNAGSPSTGVWYFLAVYRRGTTCYLRVNGFAPDTATLTGSIRQSTAPFCVGGMPGFTYWFDGRIAHVGKWNRALTDYELNFIWRRGIAAGKPF